MTSPSEVNRRHLLGKDREISVINVVTGSIRPENLSHLDHTTSIFYRVSKSIKRKRIQTDQHYTIEEWNTQCTTTTN